MTQRDFSSPGQQVLGLWRRLSGKPGGRRLFTWLLGRQVPYTGSIGARVEQLDPGHCKVTLRDRRRVRNHLNSVHALALANLGEMVSGLAMLTQLPPSVQGIVTNINTEYHKKARGALLAESQVQLQPVDAPRQEVIQAHIRDQNGDEVATTTVTWSLRPKGN
ncbi:MAG: hotdog fold domain-containing protein [Wenzhouxiangellaceae bacterium]